MIRKTTKDTVERGINTLIYPIAEFFSPHLIFHDTKNKLKHGLHAPKRFQILYVNPAKITGMIRNKKKGTLRRDSGTVLEGDWDLDPMDLAEMPKARYLRRHFVENLSWEEAGAYAYLQDQMAMHGHGDGIRTTEGMIARYAKLDIAFEDMRNSGQLKTRKQLKGGALREKRGTLVHIGRDGALIFGGGGNHRLVMSQILCLPRIPTQIGTVHAEALRNGAWAQVRSAVSQAPQR